MIERIHDHSDDIFDDYPNAQCPCGGQGKSANLHFVRLPSVCRNVSVVLVRRGLGFLGELFVHESADVDVLILVGEDVGDLGGEEEEDDAKDGSQKGFLNASDAHHHGLVRRKGVAKDKRWDDNDMDDKNPKSDNADTCSKVSVGVCIGDVFARCRDKGGNRFGHKDNEQIDKCQNCWADQRLKKSQKRIPGCADGRKDRRADRIEDFKDFFKEKQQAQSAYENESEGEGFHRFDMLRFLIVGGFGGETNRSGPAEWMSAGPVFSFI